VTRQNLTVSGWRRGHTSPTEDAAVNPNRSRAL
jgi:hypothetical protein